MQLRVQLTFPNLLDSDLYFIEVFAALPLVIETFFLERSSLNTNSDPEAKFTFSQIPF